jgi:hypothetical protein
MCRYSPASPAHAAHQGFFSDKTNELLTTEGCFQDKNEEPKRKCVIKVLIDITYI